MGIPVEFVDGGLALTFFFVFKSRPVPLGRGRFRDEDLPRPIDVVFHPENRGNPHDLTIEFEGTTYGYDRIRRFEPSPEEVTDYTGAYYSGELNTVVRVAARGNKLEIIRDWQSEPDHLEPILPDIFQGQIGSVTFTRKPDGAVAGFTLTSNFKVHFERQAWK